MSDKKPPVRAETLIGFHLELAALDLREMKNRMARVAASLKQHDPKSDIASETEKIGAQICSLERKAWEALGGIIMS